MAMTPERAAANPELAALTPRQRAKQGALRLKRRNAQALQMYLAGATYEQIAEQLEWKDKSSAYRAVRKALAEQVPLSPDEQTEEVRKMVGQLDSLWRAHYTNALRGDRAATDLALRTLSFKSKLLGLDQIGKEDPSTSSKYDDEIEALLSGLNIGESQRALEPAEEDA